MRIEQLLAGAIGSEFGHPAKDLLKADMAESVARAFPVRPGGRLFVSASSFLPDYQTQKYPIHSREWSGVPRDHSRSRHGNRKVC